MSIKDVNKSGWLFYRHLLTAYVFWVCFSALPPMIWFYPLNELDITGYEAFVLILFLPIFLNFKFLMKICQSDYGDVVINLLAILSLLSFQCPSTFWRLCLVAFGAGISAIKFTCDFCNPKTKSVSIMAYSLAYVALLTTRIMYKTMTPIFNDSYTNVASVVILLAFFVFLHFKAQIFEQKEKPNKQQFVTSSWITGLGLGCVLYIILGIFGEVSVPFRWSVSPYPTPGPQPMPWGISILSCSIAGLRLSTCKNLIQNPMWSIGGLLSYVVLYKLEGYAAFFGACYLAVYIFSVWPIYANFFAHTANPAVAMFFAVLSYLIPAFYSVWTVAYNFVPLGVYSREFTGLSIGVTMFFITLGLLINRNYKSEISLLSYPNAKSIFWKVSVTLLIFASSSMLYRYNNYKPGFDISKISDDASPKDVTAMIWTYHFGYDNAGWPSLDRTVKLIKDIDADIIGLLETDASRLYMGNNDLAFWLAESLNMYVDYGPATKKHTWGSMLLSKYPIISSEHHLLPSPEGELAPAISALLNVGGVPLGVIVTHMGNDRDDLDRKLQTEALSAISAKFVADKHPVIFLGYVTSKPGSRDYKVFTSAGKLKDIDSTDKSRFCEYIYYSGLQRLAYARIAKGRLSDTEVQTAKFRLVDSESEYEDNLSTTIESSQVPENQRYSSVFGEYRVGHYYGEGHVFHMSTPKYFLP